MLNIALYERNANQDYNEISPHYPSEWPSLKSLQTINAGEGVEKREPSTFPLLMGMQTGTATMENSVEIP